MVWRCAQAKTGIGVLLVARMLSPADLLQLASDFAASLPKSEDYKEERSVSWGMICAGWLRIDDLDEALEALSEIDEPRAAGRMRVETCKWIGAHPHLNRSGPDFLRETIAEIAKWEPWLYLSETCELVTGIYRVLGEDAVRELARAIQDGFASSSVLVALSKQVSEASRRRALLLEAESFAVEARHGDRDHALLQVSEGFADAEALEDADRVASLMEEPNLAERIRSLFSSAESAIQGATRALESSDEPHKREDRGADDPLNRLTRLLRYRYNDLKVRFLVDMAARGGVSAGEIESLLTSLEFSRVEPPRQPSVRRDPSGFDDKAFDRFWFDRPIHLHKNDEDLLRGEEFGDVIDPVAFLEKVTAMFRRFGSVGRTFSEHQIEQGLGFLLGYPFFLGGYLFRADIPTEPRLDCVRSMICPFRDYYATVERFAGSSFFMWWDNAIYRGEFRQAAIEEEIVNVLEDVLALPGQGCADAALHGLNHLHPNSRANALAREYLEANRRTMTAEQIEWVTACSNGSAL